MERIQIVLDKKLLQATDQAAERTGQNRSALVREALREHCGTWKSVPEKNVTVTDIPNDPRRQRNR